MEEFIEHQLDYLVASGLDLYEKRYMYGHISKEYISKYVVILLKKQNIQSALKFKNLFIYGAFEDLVEQYMNMSYLFENYQQDHLGKIYFDNRCYWSHDRRKEFIDMYISKFGFCPELIFNELIHGNFKNVSAYMDSLTPKIYNEYLLYIFFYEPEYLEKMLIAMLLEKIQIDCETILPTETFYNRYITTQEVSPTFAKFQTHTKINENKTIETFNKFVEDRIKHYYGTILRVAGKSSVQLSTHLNKEHHEFFSY